MTKWPTANGRAGFVPVPRLPSSGMQGPGALLRVFPSCRPPNFVDGAGLPYPPKPCRVIAVGHTLHLHTACTPTVAISSTESPIETRHRLSQNPSCSIAKRPTPTLGGSPPEGPRNPPPTAISISDRPRVDFDWVTAPSDDNTKPHALLSAPDHRTPPPVFVAAPSRIGCPRRMSVHGWTIRSNRAHHHRRHPSRTATAPATPRRRESFEL